jgi:hypothetical protein
MTLGFLRGIVFFKNRPFVLMNYYDRNEHVDRAPAIDTGTAQGAGQPPRSRMTQNTETLRLN